MAARDQREVARDAWGWLKQAEGHYNRSERNSHEELEAIKVMALAAQTAMLAEQAKY